MQVYNSNHPFVVSLDGLKEKELIFPGIQAFSKGNNKSITALSQGSREYPRKMIKANGKNFHIFESKNFRDVPNLHQDKTAMDLTRIEVKFLSASFWKKINP